MLFLAIGLNSYSQKTDLSTVNTVKPNKGQKMAFEAAYKVHVAKFHKTDDKVNVYEILTGPYAGYYHLVNSGRSYADFDKDRGDGGAHSQDLDKTFFPYLEETMNGTYRLIDSLSYKPEKDADKFVVNVSHLKQGLDINDYRRELGRTVRINHMSKAPMMINGVHTAYYEQLWDGSDQVTISIRSLKEGFKSLEQGYFGRPPEGSPGFRELYTKEFGAEAWDERVKVMEGAVVKTENYLMRLRTDLSSQ